MTSIEQTFASNTSYSLTLSIPCGKKANEASSSISQVTISRIIESTFPLCFPTFSSLQANTLQLHLLTVIQLSHAMPSCLPYKHSDLSLSIVTL